MKRVYVVLELDDRSTFDPESDQHLDELAEDLLQIADKVQGVATYRDLESLVADSKSGA